MNGESQSLQHPFLDSLKELWPLVAAFLSRPSVALVLPEKSSLEGIIFDDLFALTHCVILNPLNPSEVVTSNGLIGVIGRAAGGKKQLHIVSAIGNVNTRDPSKTFETVRPYFTQFSQDGNGLQTILVVNESEMIVNKQVVKIIQISEPISFPGSPWKRNPASLFLSTSPSSSTLSLQTPNQPTPTGNTSNSTLLIDFGAEPVIPSTKSIIESQKSQPSSVSSFTPSMTSSPNLKNSSSSPGQPQLSSRSSTTSNNNHSSQNNTTGNYITNNNKNGDQNSGNSTSSNPNAKSLQQSQVSSSSEEASFLERLKTAPEIKEMMSLFVNQFCAKPPPAADQSKLVRSTIDEIMYHIQGHKSWNNASQQDYEIASEAIEKYFMQKLYKFCFSSTTEEISRDKTTHSRLSEFQFVTMDHMDIHQSHRDSKRIDIAIEEIRLLNAPKTPRGKLTRLLNACKAIYSILNRAAPKGTVSGADDFFPILNYVVLKANPPQIHSNIQYIYRFRNPSKMITEAGYYFTHLESSIAFLEKLDASKLNIDADLFNQLLKQSQDQIYQKNQQSLQIKAEKAAEKQAVLNASLAQSSNNSSNSSSRNSSMILSQLNWHPNPSSTNSSAAQNTTQSHSPGSSTSSSPLTASLTTATTQYTNPNHYNSTGNSSINFNTHSSYFAGSNSTSPSVTRDFDDANSSSDTSVVDFHDADSSSPFRFLNLNSVYDLKVGEIAELYQAYRQLAHENYQLRTEMYRSANNLEP